MSIMHQQAKFINNAIIFTLNISKLIIKKCTKLCVKKNQHYRKTIQVNYVNKLSYVQTHNIEFTHNPGATKHTN